MATLSQDGASCASTVPLGRCVRLQTILAVPVTLPLAMSSVPPGHPAGSERPGSARPPAAPATVRPPRAALPAPRRAVAGPAGPPGQAEAQEQDREDRPE